MSTELVGRALRLEHPELTPTAKLVLVALAEAANEDDDVAWPSMSTVAKYACVDPRTVQRARDLLVKLELISEARQEEIAPARRRFYFALPANKRPKLWRITLGWQIVTPDTQGCHEGALGVTSEPVRGDTGVTQTGITKPEDKTSSGDKLPPQPGPALPATPAETTELLDAYRTAEAAPIPTDTLRKAVGR